MTYQRGQRFGRVPPETVELFQRTTQIVRAMVPQALPAQAGEAIRAYTAETVLEIVLRDWRENENTTGLLDSDVADLKSFVELAASIAGQDINGQGAPVYQATLRALLEDWLANWNAPNDPGPPGPIN